MSFFDKLKQDKLKQDASNQFLYDFLFKRHQQSRSDIAHFCEHDGIYIRFVAARSTWHALAPCALKPWWLFLQPLRMKRNNEQQKENRNNKITPKTANDTETVEETENA